MRAMRQTSASDFVSLTQILGRLRELTRQLTSPPALPYSDASGRYIYSDVDKLSRQKTARVGSLLYLEFARAAMDLVGTRYVCDATPSQDAQPRQGDNGATPVHFGIEVSLTIIEVGHVLPLIENASHLLDEITHSIRP